MGFITPGRSIRRKRKAGNTLKPLNKKKAKIVKVEVIRSKPVKEVLLEIKPISILEKLPLEILHEIFIYSGVSQLPFLSKSLNHSLKPSLSLVVKMLEMNYVHDLNVKVIKKQKELGNEGEQIESLKDSSIRFVLDKDAFQLRCITIDVLKQLQFDTVLPISSIKSETKNRLILYHDELNKKLLNRMSADTDLSPEVINRELARMANERFSMIFNEDANNGSNNPTNDINNNNDNNNDGNENENENENGNNNNDDVGMEEELDALEEDSRDFHERFYEMKKIDDEFIELVRYLYSSKKIQYNDSDKVINNLIQLGISDIKHYDTFLSFTNTGKVMTVDPLITAFRLKNKKTMDIANWIIDNLNDLELLHDVKIWDSVIKLKDQTFLDLLLKRGGIPSMDSMMLMAEFYN